jgi:hypothetical protein
VSPVSHDDSLPPPPARSRPPVPWASAHEPDYLPAWLRQTPGERRWPAGIAVIVAIALQMLLPQDLAPRPHYLLPAIEGLLLLVLVIGDPIRIEREWNLLRACGLTLVGVAALATAWSAWLLVQRLVAGGKLPAAHLLLWGSAIWLTNVIVFALGYWELDRGGPAARARARKVYCDFLFSQMTVPGLIHKDWEPGFVDYLYLSFTNATAFSPTDTLPLSWWAKLFMMAESLVSLITIALIVARAVNVLGSS